ncbi:MAG: hypothetical protein U5K74_12625 [Gemmatimonadaceae bacterium]|nr:hypothetical protein [Gemmatimonadaceae bacterium]
MAVHGIVRATGDIDILYRQSTANIGRLCMAMRDFGAPDSLIDATFMHTRDAIVQIGLPPARIDLLASISGVTFDEAWTGAIHIDLEQRGLRVLGLRDLLTNKRASNRPKDLDDVRRLEALVRASATAPLRPQKPFRRRKS